MPGAMEKCSAFENASAVVFMKPMFIAYIACFFLACNGAKSVLRESDVICFRDDSHVHSRRDQLCVQVELTVRLQVCMSL